MDTGHLQEIFKARFIKYLLVILVPFLASMLILYYLLQRKIIIPLEVLFNQSESLADKRLELPFVWSQQDEMGMLGQKLEKTRQSLHSAFQELEGLHGQAVRNSEEQKEINTLLQSEIKERIKVEEELRHHKDHLEETIRERTRELVVANENLLREFEERKRAEEERRLIALKLHRAEKMEVLGMLAGGVAHDLNNILAGTVSYPDLLLLKIDKDSELYQPLKEIQSAGKRAVAVVADLLTIARSAAITFSSHNLNNLIEEYFHSPEFQQLESSYLNVKIDLRLKAEQPCVYCSPVHVGKSLMNLMTNAYEASEDTGSITVATSNEIGHDAGRGVDIPYVVLSVRDSGTGIPQADLDRIFEPFFSTKQMGRSGSGLGLAIVWNTMAEHNGKVTVESNVEGTCFKLYFPSVPPAPRVSAKTGPVEYVRGSNEMILVVDDERLILQISERMLRELGYRVKTVSSGEEAVAFLREKRVDVVILDMVMEPGLNGKQTYEQIIKINPGQKALLVSGFAMNDDIRAALDLGVSTFLKKPYTMEELANSLHKTLRD
jgi:signal transduction histidine kinase/CheY-like chemotaxis protein